MPCDVCDRTLHGVGDGFFWCPVDGTLVEATGLRTVTKPAALDALLACARAVMTTHALRGGTGADAGDDLVDSYGRLVEAARRALGFFEPVFPTPKEAPR